MAKYYQVKVDLVIDLETSKTKAFQYLVEAVSPTDAEARVTKFLIGQEEKEFEVLAAVPSKIRDVVNVTDNE